MGDKRGQQTMWGDLTGAQSALLSIAGGRSRTGGRRPRRRSARATPRRRRARASRSRRSARAGTPRKGSAAMKRKMARLRAMRKR